MLNKVRKTCIQLSQVCTSYVFSSYIVHSNLIASVTMKKCMKRHQSEKLISVIRLPQHNFKLVLTFSVSMVNFYITPTKNKSQIFINFLTPEVRPLRPDYKMDPEIIHCLYHPVKQWTLPSHGSD